MRYEICNREGKLTTTAPIQFLERIICIVKDYADHALEVAETIAIAEVDEVELGVVH